MALTATCPWSIMKDVMRILDMKQPQVNNGTLVFSAPLYSKVSKATPNFFFIYL